MFVKLGFFLYIFGLFLYSLYTGVNYYRIQAKGWIDPRVITFLLPFIVNFFVAKFVFDKINPLFTTLAPCIMIYLIGKKMQKVRIFGLTGGIACGKSTLVQLMQQNIGSELAIIDCDKINTQLREKGHAGYKLILKLLKEEGEDPSAYVSDYSEEIKREVLSNYCFQHPLFLKKLASKVGKYILLEIFKQIWSSCVSNKKMILIDAPTLYQTKTLTHICYPIIVVGCPEVTQIERLMKTRNMTREQAQQRVRSQMPLEIKKKLSDVYIENTKDPNDMFCSTLKALNKILAVGKK